jgi:threonylcarbamoyladenosine tRNA methylthiotransferase MtaB
LKESFTYLVTSLGCKVNQAEAAWLESRLRGLGGRPAPKGRPAQVALLMTCTVTGGAARQSRQMARRLARANPGARVVVSGCDAQVNPEAYQKEGFDLAPRQTLPNLPEALGNGGGAWPPPESAAFCPGMNLPGQGRSRPQLKVQDGCDAFCAYCIVPLARGGPRSLPLDQARQAFSDLARAGAPEVVLTGIHLGLYGRDLGMDVSLLNLVEALLAEHSGPRLRLSSLEVAELSPGLLELMAREPRICPHLHLPLQSGSDSVLKAMGRPYSVAQYAGRAGQALQMIPGLCLGADVLVGLPGEDQKAYGETRELLESLDLAYLHVFPYSPRPGTPASQMPRPSAGEVQRRGAELRCLSREKRLAYYRRQVGTDMEVVSEARGRARGANYCLVRLEPAAPPGRTLTARITGLEEDGRQPILLGQPVYK